MTTTTPPPSSSSLIPPPLPTSLITTLLPHLLPPSPLPQELLAKSLLQRLLYLPPSPSDLDAHLSPYPSTEAQPVSSRLTELSHGHTLSDVLYTKEEESEIFAKINILPEDGDASGSVEIWFEFEHSSSDSRGWVYHSARLPHPPHPSSSSSSDSHTFVSTPEQLSSLLLVEHHPQQPDGTQYDEATIRDGQAPEGYWTGFDSSPSASSSPSIPPDFDEHHQQNMEDAYWAQYSRPATAPITPGIHTPYRTDLQQKEKDSVMKLSSQEEQAKKLTESLKQLGLDSLNGAMPSQHHNGYTEGLGAQEGKRRFWEEEEHAGDHQEVNEVLRQARDSDMELDKEYRSGGTAQDRADESEKIDQTQVQEESGPAVKDRLKCKISVSLNKLWKRHIKDSNEMDLEIKAIEWLNYSKQAIENSNSTSTSTSTSASTPGGGGYSAYNTIPGAGGLSAATVETIEKLEILLDMYEVLNEPNGKDSFYRLVESVIKRAPDYRTPEDEDEVLRQNMYYE
ncbi:uncharacterized protein I303_103289 [Kwoniella dejecticola CBS 10117]|uniref:Uncharacterized protein n=1 Tax=Kwoniella dejecticola CBS 10117 TaxID=1296121 RepID=A0A1A6A6B9_9TREE|nr:uncharacterized protein I303_03313 [Kwoniella dejecticola CBS 10117]OBR85602.1 hypothetical protein I303_03313 [Kwoniella dejecticola CBS 10117]